MSREPIQSHFISLYTISAITSSFALLPTEHLLGRHLKGLLFSPSANVPSKKKSRHITCHWGKRTGRPGCPAGGQRRRPRWRRGPRGRGKAWPWLGWEEGSLLQRVPRASPLSGHCRLACVCQLLTKISHGLQTTSQTFGTRSLLKVKDVPLVVYCLGSVEKALRGRPVKIPTSTHRH